MKLAAKMNGTFGDYNVAHYQVQVHRYRWGGTEDKVRVTFENQVSEGEGSWPKGGVS
jgi:hypothetical protein